MNYFKCVLSAFNITIKRKRTYNRSRYPYIQSSISEAVLSTRSNIKYLVPLYWIDICCSVSDMIVVEILAGTLNTVLICMMVILLLNFLIRPVLWTNFNVVILIYFCLNIILGAFNITLLAKITVRNFSLGKPSKIN